MLYKQLYIVIADIEAHNRLHIVMTDTIITHDPVHINDFRGVRARYVKRTG